MVKVTDERVVDVIFSCTNTHQVGVAGEYAKLAVRSNKDLYISRYRRLTKIVSNVLRLKW